MAQKKSTDKIPQTLIDEPDGAVQDSKPDEPKPNESGDEQCADKPEPLQPRTRNDLLNLRRQLKGTLDYVEATLRKQGVKV